MNRLLYYLWRAKGQLRVLGCRLDALDRTATTERSSTHCLKRGAWPFHAVSSISGGGVGGGEGGGDGGGGGGGGGGGSGDGGVGGDGGRGSSYSLYETSLFVYQVTKLYLYSACHIQQS